MKVVRWRVVFIIVIMLMLTVSLSGCMEGKGKVAVIPLSGAIAGVSQQGLLTTGGISSKLVRDYLKKAVAMICGMEAMLEQSRDELIRLGVAATDSALFPFSLAVKR